MEKNILECMEFRAKMYRKIEKNTEKNHFYRFNQNSTLYNRLLRGLIDTNQDMYSFFDKMQNCRSTVAPKMAKNGQNGHFET